MNTLLTVHDLTMRFGGVTALNRVHFTVEPARITALIGPNGAGKTTVFNCLTGFYKATEGRILFHPPGNDAENTGHTPINLTALLGEPLRINDLWPPRALGRRLFYKLFGGTHRISRTGIARTFQNIRLFNDMTVMENLLVAQHDRVECRLLPGLLQTASFRHKERQAVARASAWLHFFDLAADANRLAGELPYGHQRRLEIARALCTEPHLLCLDEPAAGLNPRETRELSQLILSLKEQTHAVNGIGITLLLIEHDMGMVMSLSDHVVVLDHGEVIARGTPQEIQDNPHVLAAYLGIEEA